MNKDLLKQIPAEEQPMASKLSSLIDDMQPSEAFQWDLENQLLNQASTTQPSQRGGWFRKIMVPIGWSLAAICGVLLLNWMVRSFAPEASPAAGTTVTPEVSFAESVQAGDICAGPLALSHGFAIFLTNPESNEFHMVDAGTMFEVRSFTWSPDGERLAIVGNAMGSGAVHISQPMSGELEYLLSGSDVGYLRDVAWSRDGKQLVMWSSQNNQTLYVLNAEGNDLVEKRLDVFISGTPQFAPAGESVFFLGGDATSGGLFEAKLSDGQTSLINPQVEDETAFAFSPHGSHLAYVEMDREAGEARLITEELTTGEETLLGTLPIPKGSGASIPDAANLSWSADSQSIVFDFGRGPGDRAIYLANVDGSGMTEVVEGYAPSISADGKCLAYISEDQVFLMDLSAITSQSTAQPPVLLADLPTGRGNPNFKQDKLQWRP